jgi:hypothetical protein
MRARSRPLAVLSVAAALIVVAGSWTGALGQTHVHRYRPDVMPVAISASAGEIQIAIGGGHEELQFALKSENAGAGALELRPKRQDCNGNGNLDDDRTAFQNIYGDTNGNGRYDPPGSASPDHVAASVQVGCFEFDPAHGHWHFANYAKYTLLDPNGVLVGVTRKTGFCLIDFDRVDPGLPGSPPSPHYASCADLHVQGTSVGYDDIYGAYLDGQSITIDGIADGDYCLVERVNPKRVIRELDRTNDTLRTPIRIAGTTVTDGGTAC